MSKQNNCVIYSSDEIAGIRDVAQRTAEVRDTLCKRATAGMTTWEIDRLGQELCENTGGQCAFYNYRNFPGHICVSLNDVVVHGIGRLDQRLTKNTVMSLDVGIRLNGFVGDTAATVCVGEGEETAPAEIQHLMKTTQKSLWAGIDAARSGNRVNDIGKTVEKVVKAAGCNVIRDFVGHGCGREMHEPPEVPNFYTKNANQKLVPGMVLAIEPMVTTGSGRITVDSDGWTVRTEDGNPAVHFEHMVLITNGKPEVLTWRRKKQ